MGAWAKNIYLKLANNVLRVILVAFYPAGNKKERAMELNPMLNAERHKY
jgi:hypothetical protein